MASLLYFSTIPPIWDAILAHLDLEALKTLRLSLPNCFPQQSKPHFVKYLETITVDLTTERFVALEKGYSPWIKDHVRHLTIQAVYYYTCDLKDTIREAAHHKLNVNNLITLQREVAQVRDLAAQQQEAHSQPSLTIGRLGRLLKRLGALETVNIVGVIRNGRSNSVKRLPNLIGLATQGGRAALDSVSSFAFHITIMALIESQARVEHLNVFARGSAREWAFTSNERVSSRPQCTVSSNSFGWTVDLIRRQYSTRTNILNLRALSIQVEPISTPLWAHFEECVRQRMQSLGSVRVIATAPGLMPRRRTHLSELFEPPFVSEQTSIIQGAALHWTLENFSMTLGGILELIRVSSASLLEFRNIRWIFDNLASLPSTLNTISRACHLDIRVLTPTGYRRESLSGLVGVSYSLHGDEYRPGTSVDDHHPQVFIVIEEPDFRGYQRLLQ